MDLSFALGLCFAGGWYCAGWGGLLIKVLLPGGFVLWVLVLWRLKSRGLEVVRLQTGVSLLNVSLIYVLGFF